VIDGHNARLTAAYSRIEPGTGLDKLNQFKIRLQLQF